MISKGSSRQGSQSTWTMARHYTVSNAMCLKLLLGCPDARSTCHTIGSSPYSCCRCPEPPVEKLKPTAPLFMPIDRGGCRAWLRNSCHLGKSISFPTRNDRVPVRRLVLQHERTVSCPLEDQHLRPQPLCSSLMHVCLNMPGIHDIVRLRRQVQPCRAWWEYAWVVELCPHDLGQGSPEPRSFQTCEANSHDVQHNTAQGPQRVAFWQRVSTCSVSTADVWVSGTAVKDDLSQGKRFIAAQEPQDAVQGGD